MIIILKKSATKEDADRLMGIISEQGLEPLYMPGSERTVLGALGDERVLATLALDAYPFVDRVLPILSPYKRASRELQTHDTVVKVGPVSFGPGHLTVIAGPCAVENEAQIMESARVVKAAGGHMLRGGAYKPRTSPYSFQGLEEEGLRLLSAASKASGLPVVTEITDVHDIDKVIEHADMFQVGARNMQNFSLLKEIGKCSKPVLLKRGLSATIEELLMAAEYIMAGGNHQVVLCERGIRTFETATRSTLDLSAVPVLKERTHLPVIVDPSHAAGVRELVIPLALAAVAAGADGLIVEVHPNPDEALCDKDQALTADQLRELVRGAEAVVRTQGRTF